MSVNKVILLGNVGGDPEVRYPDKGMAVARFSLATNERNGDVERTEWHNIVMVGRHGELAERYIRKGSRIYLEGKLRSRQWEDKFQIKRTVTEIYVDYFELIGRSN
jgi:single-strand DNA-binding protein